MAIGLRRLYSRSKNRRFSDLSPSHVYLVLIRIFQLYFSSIKSKDSTTRRFPPSSSVFQSLPVFIHEYYHAPNPAKRTASEQAQFSHARYHAPTNSVARQFHDSRLEIQSLDSLRPHHTYLGASLLVSHRDEEQRSPPRHFISPPRTSRSYLFTDRRYPKFISSDSDKINPSDEKKKASISHHRTSGT